MSAIQTRQCILLTYTPNLCRNAGACADSLLSLQKQYDDLVSQFHGFSSPSTQDTLIHANDPSLESDFTHARSGPFGKEQQLPKKTSLRIPLESDGDHNGPKPSIVSSSTTAKTVRFSDDPARTSNTAAEAELFGQYRDDPSAGRGPGYADSMENEGMSNVQIHAYHDRIMREQDEQLDALGATIGRQRELSLRIGDELDEHVQMLDHMDTSVERHGSRLGRARQGITKVVKGVGESKQMMIIVLLILILVILIAITK